MDATSGLVPAPATLAVELRPCVDALREAAGPGCRAIYLHGSALTPRFDAKSDINLLIVIADLPQSLLDALARVFSLHREVGGRRTRPLLLTDEQILRSSDVFPVEFQDFKARRALLWGDDVLGSLRIGRGHLRHQCESELRSKLVGLRQAYLLGGGGSDLAAALLARAAGGSAAVYRGLLELRGVDHPPEDADALTGAVCSAYGVDANALEAPFLAHRNPPTGAAASAMFAAYASALEALIVAVDALPGD